MTSGTFSLVDRRVLGDGFLLFLHGVRMTRAAKVFHGFLEESCLPGGMGAMAVQAGVSVHEGPVHPFLVQHVVQHIAMASPA